MTILPILEVPHPLLRQKAAAVERIDADLLRLMDDMLETMYRAPGIGLAAPQVGVLARVVVVDVARDDEPPQPIRLVNPALTWRSEETVTREEGCLSLPEQFAEVRRPVAVKVAYTDATGAACELAGDGLLARCLQHELDHLDGVLFVDHLSALKRGMLLRRLAKARRLRA